MKIAIWLLVIAWSLEALVSSIPWFVQAGANVFAWAHHSGLLAIIALHAAGTLLPIIAAVSLWSGQRLIACLTLALLSISWLFWHISMFTQLAPLWRDGARVLLSVTTLAVVLVYSVEQARSGIPGSGPGVG
jgi:VIT1/CCC1 family predicted Fe2+/Mn2+ transporter